MSQENHPEPGSPQIPDPEPAPVGRPGQPTSSPFAPSSRTSATRQLDAALNQVGVDLNLATKVLIVAAVSGLAAAVLDEVLGLPSSSLRLTFGWMIAALNGATYAFFKRHDDSAGLLMSAVAGLVAFLVWFIVMEIIGGEYGLSWGLNVFKAIVTGLIAGLIGFGWFALMRKLPDKLIP